MRIVFPHVEGESARPVEIRARIPSPLLPGQDALDRHEIEALELDDVLSAAALLQLPRMPRAPSWAVGWGSGSRPKFNGASAQLAALVALIAAQPVTLAKPRGWLSGDASMWVTGTVRIVEELGEVAVGPVGRHNAEDLAQKFRAFCAADAKLFVCACEDAGVLMPLMRRHKRDAKLIGVGKLRGILRRPMGGQSYVVAVGPEEARALLDALFHGVFPRNAGFLVANVLTGTRLLVAAPLVAWFVWNGDMPGVAASYAIGLATDVGDGFAARVLHGTSEFGKRFDRQVDMAFNTVSLGAYAVEAATRRSRPWEAGTFLGLTLGVVVVTRLLGVKPPASALAKLRSGWIRLVMLAYVVWRIDWSRVPAPWMIVAVAVAAILGAGGVYEIRETLRDVRLGRRGWCTKKTPPCENEP